MGDHFEDGTALDIFQHRVAQRLTGRQPSKQGDGSWAYPPFAEAMGEAGSEEIRKVCHEEAEHGRTVYCDTTNSGPL